MDFSASEDNSNNLQSKQQNSDIINRLSEIERKILQISSCQVDIIERLEKVENNQRNTNLNLGEFKTIDSDNNQLKCNLNSHHQIQPTPDQLISTLTTKDCIGAHKGFQFMQIEESVNRLKEEMTEATFGLMSLAVDVKKIQRDHRRFESERNNQNLELTITDTTSSIKPNQIVSSTSSSVFNEEKQNCNTNEKQNMQNIKQTKDQIVSIQKQTQSKKNIQDEEENNIDNKLKENLNFKQNCILTEKPQLINLQTNKKEDDSKLNIGNNNLNFYQISDIDPERKPNDEIHTRLVRRKLKTQIDHLSGSEQENEEEKQIFSSNAISNIDSSLQTPVTKPQKQNNKKIPSQVQKSDDTE